MTAVIGDLNTNFTPTANAIPTNGGMVIQGTTSSSNSREFLGSCGLTSNLAGGDKVAFYAGIDAQSGTSDVWSLNTVITMEPDSGTYNAQGYELDFNNFNMDCGDDVNFSAPLASGLSITGAGTFLSTCAMLVSGPGIAPIWNRGILFANNSIQQSCIQDHTSAVTTMTVGGTHSYGIDFTGGTFSQAAIAYPNNTYMAWRTADNTEFIADIVDTVNNRQIGVGAANVISNASFLPVADNAYANGTVTLRWTSVWAVNGAIQTSDPKLKTDIHPLPSTLNLVNNINPVTYKWKVGGYTIDPQTKQQTEHSGKRTHWGFLAPEIKSEFDKLDMDFGGYVKAEDGTECLRPDQLISVLWKAVQELSTQVTSLKGQVDALQKA